MHKEGLSHDPEFHRQLWVAVAPLLNAWFNDFRKAHPAEAVDIDTLLTKREIEPGLEPFLLAKMKGHAPTQVRRKEMVQGLVLSILKGEGFAPKTHSKDSDLPFPSHPKTRQRFYQEFSDLFPQVSVSKREILRTSIVAPKFAAQNARLRAMGERALRQFAVQGTIAEPLPYEARNWCRLCNPVFVDDLARFQREALRASQSGGVNGGPQMTPHGRHFVSNLKTISDILVMLHANITGILAAEWFRSRRPETRRAILQKTHTEVMTPESANQAFGLLKELYGNEGAAAAVFERASAPFIKNGSWEYGFILLSRAYDSPNLSDHVRGAFSGNMAYMLKRGGHEREAVQLFSKSVECHAKAGDRFDLVIAIRDLAEAMWKSERSDASDLVKAGIRISAKLAGRERDDALYNFVTMFERLRETACREWADALRVPGRNLASVGLPPSTV